MDQTPEGSQPADQQPAAPPPPPSAVTPPPPPAAPVPPPPAPVAQTRPGVITAVAVLEFIGGGFGILAALLVTFGGGMLASVDTQLSGVNEVGGILIAIAVVIALVSAVQIYAGTQVLKLRERGRIISIVLSSISLVLMLLSVTQGQQANGAVLSLVLNGFIIYACVSNKEAFSENGI